MLQHTVRCAKLSDDDVGRVASDSGLHMYEYTEYVCAFS